MKAMRGLSRRSFLERVAGGAIAGAALIVMGAPAQALQITDSDSGPNADPANGGRGNRGHTDADRGPNADPAGQGRGISDFDRGSNADPAGRGRRRGGCRGITDSDSGNGIWTDPARCGRGRHH
jgi:hypothetical protein